MDARRQQTPLSFNHARVLEWPVPDLDGAFEHSGEVPIDANAVEGDESVENDPLGDIKPELVLFTIDENDRVELQRMLTEGTANADESASALEQGAQNMDESNAVAATTNANSHIGDDETAENIIAPIAGPAYQHVDENNADANTINANFQTPNDETAVKSACIAEPTNQNVGEQNAAAATTNTNSQTIDDKTADNIAASIAGSADQHVDKNIADANTSNTNLQTTNSNAAESANGNKSVTAETAECNDDDDEIIFEGEFTPMPMGDFRHALVKHENDELSRDLCYKLVVS